MTVTDFTEFAGWYSQRRARTTGRAAAPRTVESKVGHLRLVARLMGCHDHTALGKVGQDRESLNSCLDVLHARMSPGSVRSHCYTLRAYFEWAKARGLVECNVLLDSDIPPPNPLPAISVYSRDEVEAFIAAARGQGLRWWALVTFMADSGRRIGDALSLRWEGLRLHEPPGYFELPHNKSGKPQYVPLTRRLHGQVFTEANIATLAGEYRTGRRRFSRAPSEWVFPWTYNSTMKRLRYFCETANMPYKGWHAFRHTVITERLAAGVPLHAVAKLAGHSSVAVTQARYDHTDALSFARYVERDWQQ